jgi:methionyl-tRNA formyltransferase
MVWWNGQFGCRNQGDSLSGVVFIGGGELANECLVNLLKIGVQVSLVIPTHFNESRNIELKRLALEMGVPSVHDSYDVSKLRPFHSAFSIGNFKILNNDFLSLAKNGVFGVHAAPLPEYRGSACPAFAILNGETEFGVTVHRVNRSLDAGAIIHLEKFLLSNDMTAFDLDARCISTGIEIFADVARLIINEKFKEKPNDCGRPAYRRKDIEPFRRLTLSMTHEEIDRKIRACDWPGVLQPAYLESGGRKYFMTYKNRGDFLPY